MSGSTQTWATDGSSQLCRSKYVTSLERTRPVELVQTRTDHLHRPAEDALELYSTRLEVRLRYVQAYNLQRSWDRSID
jgi:hypothetical protein